MNELIFIVEEAPEGGYIARALGESIFTEADLVKLYEMVRDALRCHFEESQGPKMICLHDVAAHFELSREQLAEQLFDAGH